MRIYIANCTAQTFQLQYRLDYNTSGEVESRARFQPAKQQEIAPGRQAQIGGDMHINQIEDIIQQLSLFGLVGEVDVPHLKTTFKKFDPASIATTPLVFQIDKPVSVDVMRQVRGVNSEILIEQGQLRRQRAAIAVNDLVTKRVANEFAAAGIDAEPADNVSLGIEQLEQSEAGERRIEEGYRLDRRAPPTPAQAKSKNSKKRR